MGGELFPITVHYRMACLLEDVEKYEEALEECQEIRRRDSDYADIKTRTEAIEKGGGIHYRFFSVMMALLFVTAAGITLWQAHGEGTFEPVTGADGSVVALDGSADAIGGALFRHWLLAFEVTSILLLGAILGAVILTKRRLT